MNMKYLNAVVAALLVLTGAACVQTQVAEGGIGGTGMVAKGRITGFGSVYVNGVKYETTDASFLVEGAAADQSSLAVGMVVTVEGTVNADGVTGTATTVRYADELEGIVQAVDPFGTSLTVMGHTVMVRSDTVLAEVAALSDIVPGAVVEVSGYSNGTGTIYASRIERKSASWTGEEMEVKGVIDSVSPSEYTFRIGALTVNYAEPSEGIELPNGQPEVGLFVEVKSVDGFDAATGALVASRIELEDDGDRELRGDEGDEVEFEGIVTGIAGLPDVLQVNGQDVRVDGADTEESGIPDPSWLGRRVEVEGRFDASGMLVAEEVEIEVDETLLVELTGSALVTDAGLTLMGLPVVTDSTTLYVDEVNHDPQFNADFIHTGDWIEVYGKVADDGSILAVKVEHEPFETGDLWELEGPIETVLDSTTVIVAGITAYLLDGTTVSASDQGSRIEMDGTYTAAGTFTAEEASVGGS